MLASLDLTPVFSGRRTLGDVASLRPLFYGTQPPPEFLMRSVDRARDITPEDLANPLLPVHWLVEPRDAVGEEGMTPSVVSVLKARLARVLDCSLSPRERLQVWYCLRSLGVQPEPIDADHLLGVIFEFQSETGLSFLSVYSDRFCAALWEGGSRKWPPYEEGTISLLAQDILKESLFYADLAIKPQSDLPPVSVTKSVRVSYLYPAGIRCVELPVASIQKSTLRPLYNQAASLFSLMCAGEGTFSEPPMDLSDPRWLYGSLSSRTGASLLDAAIYGALLFGIFYFSWSSLAKWDQISLALLLIFLLALPSLIGAWMESSASWGFRTVGKHVFGLAVYSTSDSMGPLFVQALARNLAKWFISLPFLACGFVWAFFHRYRRTWHDVLANTVVLVDEQRGDTEVDGLQPASPEAAASAAASAKTLG